MTATVYETPAPLAAYLRRATLGLSAAQREEVWNELEEHVLCRAERLEVTGLTPDEALAQALRELGPPLKVSAGMNGVHNMPKMIAIGTVTMLAVSAGLYALAQQTGPTMQVNLQTKAPALNCVGKKDTVPHQTLIVTMDGWKCYQDESHMQDGAYISLSELSKILKPVSITATAQSDGQIEFKRLGNQIGMALTRFRKGGESYIDISDLIGLLTGGQPVVVEAHSYAKPTFSLGKAGNITIAGQDENSSRQIYQALAKSTAQSVFDFSKQGKYWSYTFKQPEIDLTEQTIHTELKADEVVAAYQYSGVKSTVNTDGVPLLDNEITFSVGVVDSQGNVKLKLPQKAKFVTDVPNRPSQSVLLIRLTNTPLNNLKSGIFLPKS